MSGLYAYNGGAPAGRRRRRPAPRSPGRPAALYAYNAGGRAGAQIFAGCRGADAPRLAACPGFAGVAALETGRSPAEAATRPSVSA